MTSVQLFAVFSVQPVSADLWRYHCVPVGGGTATVTHAHAAEPNSRNFQVAVSKFALLHFLYSCLSVLIC
jgi:hypothetical protein